MTFHALEVGAADLETPKRRVRGVYRTEYSGTPLREHLDLA